MGLTGGTAYAAPGGGEDGARWEDEDAVDGGEGYPVWKEA